MPRLQALYDEYGSRGFVPISINLWENMESVVKYYARQYNYPFLRDYGGVWNMYKINSYIPLNYVIDTLGVVVNGTEGFNETTIRAWIESALGPVGVSEIPVQEPVRLTSVYPNPASGPTTVRFSLARAGHVRLQVRSSAGRLVRTLLSGSAEAGHTNVRWDLTDDVGREVATGMYFMELTTSQGSARLKVSVLK